MTLLLLIGPSPFDSAILTFIAPVLDDHKVSMKICECTVCQRNNSFLSLTSTLLQAYM